LGPCIRRAGCEHGDRGGSAPAAWAAASGRRLLRDRVAPARPSWRPSITPCGSVHDGDHRGPTPSGGRRGRAKRSTQRKSRGGLRRGSIHFISRHRRSRPRSPRAADDGASGQTGSGSVPPCPLSPDDEDGIVARGKFRTGRGLRWQFRGKRVRRVRATVPWGGGVGVRGGYGPGGRRRRSSLRSPTTRIRDVHSGAQGVRRARLGGTAAGQLLPMGSWRAGRGAEPAGGGRL
jgi:hypothetical protein